MSGALAGRVVLVTGGAGGLGTEIGRVLLADGARVMLADLDEGRARSVAAMLADAVAADGAAEGAAADGLPDVDGCALDVGDAERVGEVVARTIARFGRLDAVINNAAIDITQPIESISPQEWARVLATNLTGPFLVTRAALSAMRQGGGGHVVNIASTASRRAWPNASAYHATKWGLLGLSHALHAELRPMGIKVSAVIAGGMRTPFLLDRFPDIDPRTLQDPRNVAAAVRFVLTQPAETVVPEVMVLPMTETSWP